MRTEDDTVKKAVRVVRYEVTHHCGACELTPELRYHREGEGWNGERLTIYRCDHCHAEYILDGNPTYEIEKPA